MYIAYYKEYSHFLGRDMEFKVYGHSGKPCVVFPAQDGRFFDYEGFGMVECIKNYIEEGKIQLFCVDSIDLESWSRKNGDYQQRIEQHEKWFNYIINEAIPRFREIYGETSGNYYYGKFLTTGCSMGAYHSANFFFRRPDVFDSVISLSGLYDANFFFPNHFNELIYNNSPVEFLRNMPWNHPYLDIYRNSKIVICVGQGRWEEECIRDTNYMKENLERLQVPAWIDYWGYDVDHDWPWWRVQLPYFLSHIL
ncbi:esterase family protein [Fusobacterium perfoetens]|uniref:esterase family protein n=1 Tax=Fusobacterium perfoetens TaxID=852 RepID=UPI000481F706|nr:alpha/beta hydrolase-fold protein [Fusobacterium perfoetens]MCI6152030.1 alpha/beta hydrolase-fold protein [Fusobacterium perfoetens]MDY3238079.1 alpha/beta hydrolase-fold protein [Fusobacterium perfoetens]